MEKEDLVVSTLMLSASIQSASKVIYILYHELDESDVAAILKSCGLNDTVSAEFVLATRALVDTQSKYRNIVMNNWRHPKVALIMVSWKKRHLDDDFENLVMDQRRAVWHAAFDASRQSTVEAM
jgi:hypothetical protein